MTEQAFFYAEAARMARLQGDYLRQHIKELHPEIVVAQAVNLIHDWVRYLGRRDLAIRLVLDVHPTVERWSLWQPWVAVLDELLDAWQVSESDLDRAHLLNFRSQAARELSDLPTAFTTAEQALALASAHHDQALSAAALNKLGRIAICQDHIEQAQAYWEQAYQLSEGSEQPLEVGHISMNLGLIATAQGRVAAAEHYFDHALRHYQLADDAYHIAKVHCNRADLASRSGRLMDVPDALFTARDIFRSLGARYDYGLSENDIGSIYLHLQQYRQADEAFQTALRIFEELGSLSGRIIVLSNLGDLLVTIGDWERAVNILMEAHELALAYDRPLLIAAIDIDRGRILHAQGDLIGAAQLWQDALATQEAHGVDAAQRTRELLASLHIV